MKKTLLALALCAATTAMANDSETTDTIVVYDAQKVTVIANDKEQTINIEGTQRDPNYRYSNRIELVDSNYVSAASINDDSFDIAWNIFGHPTRSTRQKAHHAGSHWHFKMEMDMSLAFGFNNAVDAPANIETRPFSSWDIWFIPIGTRYYLDRRNSFSVGVGVEWRNYRMKNDMQFVKEGQQVLVAPFPADVEPNFSRVKVFSVNFPLLYRFKTRHVGFSLGPVVNLNMHSSLKTRYKVDGHKKKHTQNDVYANPVTVDLMGMLHIGTLDLYCKYSPMSILDTDHAPDFKGISFGIML